MGTATTMRMTDVSPRSHHRGKPSRKAAIGQVGAGVCRTALRTGALVEAGNLSHPCT
jgi:hypothetical protein